jgi:hypothetical protein
MRKLITRASAMALLVLGICLNGSAQAAQFSFEVRSDANNSLLGSGTLDTGAATVATIGSQTLNASQGLLLSFTSLVPGLSGTFTQADDDFDVALASFLDGAPVGLNFLVTAASAPGGFGFASNIESISSTSLVIGFDTGARYGYFTGNTFGTGTLNFEVVPEPNAMAGSLLLGLLGLMSKSRLVPSGARLRKQDHPGDS